MGGAGSARHTKVENTSQAHLEASTESNLKSPRGTLQYSLLRGVRENFEARAGSGWE